MSSKSSQSTTIPDPTPEEKALMGMMTDSLMPAYLNQAGYDVKKTTSNYIDSAEYKNFQSQRDRIQTQKDTIQRQIDSLRPNTNAQQRQTLLQSLAKTNSQLDNIDRQQSEFVKNYEPEISYSTRKMQAPEVEAARTKLVAQYGDLSDAELATKDPSYKALADSYAQKEVDNDIAQRKVADTYMEKTQKFLDGDFSITEDQKKLIQENMAPIKAAADKLFADAKSEVGKTNTSLLEATKTTFDNFNQQVKQTGMDMNTALEATGAQIKQTGADMESALKNTIGIHTELMKMGIEDYTGQVTKQIAGSAASIGRSPGDPEYTNEMKQLVARKVQEGSLNLAAMESQGLLAIKERTGSGLEDILRQKTAVAERTGGALEQSALQRGQQNTSIAERTGAANESLVNAQGQSNMSLEESAANLRWNVGAGMVPQQISVAQGVGQYAQAQAQQRISNASSAMYSGMPFTQSMQSERMAQPTTTTRTNSGIGGVFSGIIGAASAGASIYSGVASAGAMNQMADTYANNPYMRPPTY